MRSHRDAVLAIPAALITILAACQGAPTAAPPVTATRAPTPTAAPTPTPTLQAAIPALSLVPGGTAGDWTAVGLLENRSPFAVGRVTLRVSVSSGGQVLAEQSVEASLHHLAPGEQTPFVAHFQGSWIPSEAEAEVTGYEPANFERAAVNLVDLDTAPSRAGGLVILGRVANRGEDPVELSVVTLLARSAEGQLMGVAEQVAGLTYLEPGQSAPFLALYGSTGEVGEFVAFTDAITAPEIAPAPVELAEYPVIRLDAQGDPFLVGVARNRDHLARWVSLLIGLDFDGRLIALAEVDPPVPLAPGESRPFSVTDLPGMEARLSGVEWSAEDLRVTVWIDPLASAVSEPRVTELGVQVESFEPIGGSLFVRGAATNRASVTVESPTLFASVRSTEGILLSAGWEEIGPALEPGRTARFVLVLPLPDRMDLAMAEYDVRGLGLLP